MAKLVIRPTTKADCEAFYGQEIPYRIKAYTGLLDDEIIAIGGIAHPPESDVMAFADLTGDARARAVSLHKFARKVLSEAKEAGVKRLLATVERSEPAAERWLKRLGFTPLTMDNEVWEWRD